MGSDGGGTFLNLNIKVIVQSAFTFFTCISDQFASYPETEMLPNVKILQSELFNANLDLHTRANSYEIKRIVEEFNSYWLGSN